MGFFSRRRNTKVEEEIKNALLLDGKLHNTNIVWGSFEKFANEHDAVTDKHSDGGQSTSFEMIINGIEVHVNAVKHKLDWVAVITVETTEKWNNKLNKLGSNLGICTKCNNVGKIYDGLCQECAPTTVGSNFQRLKQSMPILKWGLPLLFLLQLSTPFLFQAIATSSPTVATAAGIPPVEEQFLFSLFVVGFLIVPIAICYTLRFHLIRRRIHIIISLLFTFFIFSLPLGAIFAMNDGTPGGVSVLAMVAGYKILRINNIDDAIKTSNEANK